jgi:hypothetical protein
MSNDGIVLKTDSCLVLLKGESYPSEDNSPEGSGGIPGSDRRPTTSGEHVGSVRIPGLACSAAQHKSEKSRRPEQGHHHRRRPRGLTEHGCGYLAAASPLVVQGE